MSDVQDNERQKPNWQGYIGAGLTVVSMSVAGFQWVSSVNAKADMALSQITEMKQDIRQTKQDSRADLQQMNTKLDTLTLMVGRLNGGLNSGKD